MKSKNWLILLIFCLICRCATLQITGPGYEPEQETYLSSLNNFPQTEEGIKKRDLALKYYRFFEVIDKNLFKQLQKMDAYSDSLKIDSLMESFKIEQDLKTSAL